MTGSLGGRPDQDPSYSAPQPYTPYQSPQGPASDAGYPQNQPYPQGQPYPSGPMPPPGYGYPQPRPGNGLGVAGFVCGLLGLIFCWVPFLGIILAILGVVLGGAGMSSARKNHSGSGLAIAGLVLGIIALIPAIIIIVAVSTI